MHIRRWMTPTSALAAVAIGSLAASAPPAGASAIPSSAAERTIDLEIVVDSDARTLYELFSTSAGLTALFPGAKASIGRAVGEEYLVAFDPEHPDGVVNGTAGCRILALEPAHHLAFEWRGPVWADEMNVEPLPTWVEVDFSPTPDGATRVRLRHFGFAAPDGANWDRAYRFFDEGWGRMLTRLQARHTPVEAVAAPGS